MHYYDSYTQLNKLAKINLNILIEEIWEDAKSKWPWTYLVYANKMIDLFSAKICVLGLFILNNGDCDTLYQKIVQSNYLE